MPTMLHARIKPAQINGLIMRSSRPRPAVLNTSTNEIYL